MDYSYLLSFLVSKLIGWLRCLYCLKSYYSGSNHCTRSVNAWERKEKEACGCGVPRKKGLVGPTGARGACDRPRRGDNYELVSRHVCEIVLVMIVRVRQPLGPDKSKSNSTLTNNTIIDQTLPR